METLPKKQVKGVVTMTIKNGGCRQGDKLGLNPRGTFGYRFRLLHPPLKTLFKINLVVLFITCIFVLLIVKNVIMDKFSTKNEWSSWLGKEIIKHSNKPFKSGFKTGVPKEMVINEHSNKEAFIMNDGSVVDCYQCTLKV